MQECRAGLLYGVGFTVAVSIPAVFVGSSKAGGVSRYPFLICLQLSMLRLSGIVACVG